MKRKNVRIKKNLGMEEMISLPQVLSDGYFSINDNDEMDYTPYYYEVALITGFFTYCVEGLQFEKDKEGKLEDIYEVVTADKELFDIYKQFITDLSSEENNTVFIEQMRLVMREVVDIVEFRKQKLIHQNKDSLSNLIDALTEQVESLDLKNTLNTLNEFVGIDSGEIIQTLLKDKGIPEKE